MKKVLSFMAAAALAAGCLAGCTADAAPGSVQAQAEDQKDAVNGTSEQTLKIVTTIFPEYDWVNAVLGEKAANAEVTMLLDNGVDLHSYQPTVDDMVKISECDMFVYVGGESDEWVEDVLATAMNKDMEVINLLDVLGDTVRAEEVVEGMEHEHEHEHEESEAYKKEVKTFEDDEVQDRSLDDWAGEWQSAYPFVLDGSLDEGFEHKAESGSMTAEEYKDYYATGYETDIAKIVIDGKSGRIDYTYTDGSECGSTYKYLGYYIQNWSTGTKAAMYRFEAEDKESGAPVYIEFNDHIIEPVKAEHFHFRSSDTSFDDIEDPEKRWPTFYPAEFDSEEMLDAFIGHDHGSDEEDHDHEHEEEMDEHVWLSLRNTQTICDAIAGSLGKIDSANAEVYKANAEAYKEKLAALDSQYKDAVDNAEIKTLLFGDRFPFRYLVDDYGIDYYAAFTGCSAESEASFETIVFLAGKVDELGLSSIMTIEGNNKIAGTIRDNTKSKDQKILVMDSMQSTTSADIAGGKTYLSVMESNLEVLKEALSR